MKILAIDPDFHSTSWAIVSNELPDNSVYCEAIGVIRVPKKFKERQAIEATIIQARSSDFDFSRVLVELPRLYPKSKIQPNDLIGLSAVAGGVAAKLAGDKTIRLVYPQEWKGTVDKLILQKRICKKLGWEYLTVGKRRHIEPQFSNRAVIPLGREFIESQAWFHVLDAIGLGLWGLQRCKLSNVIDRYKQKD